MIENQKNDFVHFLVQMKTRKFAFERSIFQMFWKPHCCTKFLFLKLTSPEIHHRLSFDQGFLFWTQIVPAQWYIITNLQQLYYYCRSQKAVIILPLTTSTIVIHLPQIKRYAPFTHWAGPIWVQNQNFWSKPGLWRRSVINISKNKNLLQQCGFQKIWKIHLWSWELILPNASDVPEATLVQDIACGIVQKSA